MQSYIIWRTFPPRFIVYGTPPTPYLDVDWLSLMTLQECGAIFWPEMRFCRYFRDVNVEIMLFFGVRIFHKYFYDQCLCACIPNKKQHTQILSTFHINNV